MCNSTGNPRSFFPLEKEKLFDEISEKNFPFFSMVLPCGEVLPCLLPSMCLSEVGGWCGVVPPWACEHFENKFLFLKS